MGALPVIGIISVNSLSKKGSDAVLKSGGDCYIYDVRSIYMTMLLLRGDTGLCGLVLR